ncbi:serine/threonine protein kinase [bacterium]|jgi:eukaryotic-like serine/threonine-protein kinase|nr:serine/threonine protein kinase [bacterium]
MQAPTTIDEFLSLAVKGKLLDPGRCATIQSKLAESSGHITEPRRLAELLIRQNILTRFQADQLLLGRAKGFWVKNYKILDQVGIGGMARVFLAEHAIMRRKVALKVLPTSKCSDPPSLARFLREARAIASINHPNVIRAFDIDQDADFYYIVLEFAEGLTVAQYVEKHGAIPWPQACDYTYQSAAGLEHLLSCGLIHRDIKPSNIIIEKTGTIKLVDLGLAVFFEEKEMDPLTLKYDQNVLGTADYLAPEQAIDSHNVDGRADIYSLGATLCFMLCGQPPFPDGTIAERLHAHQSVPFESIRDRAPDVPKDLDAILRKMLAKKPEDRFASMTQLRAALRRFLPINSVSAQLSGTFAMLQGQTAETRRAEADETLPGQPILPGSPVGESSPRPTSKSDIRVVGPPKQPASRSKPNQDDVALESDTSNTDSSTTLPTGLSQRMLLGTVGGTLMVVLAVAVGYFYLYQ